MAETLPPSDPRIQKIRETLEAGMPKDAEGNPIVETFGAEPGSPKVRFVKDKEGKLHIAKEGEPPDAEPPPEKPTQLSFGEFNATKDLERGIRDIHETFGNIQRSDNPFANPKHTKEIKEERKRNKRIYGRRKTKGDVLRRLNNAK